MIARPDHIDGELAWGYWLRLEDRGGKPTLIDAQGSEWPTIREAFMKGRLRMQKTHGIKPERMFEQLLSVLIAVLRPLSTRDPAFTDMFGGNTEYGEFFMNWLEAEGLVVGGDSYRDWRLTQEGASAMRMLFATRPNAIGAIRPSRASLDELLRLGLGPDLGEPGRAKVEAAATGWPSAFLRQNVGGQPTIIAVISPEGGDHGGVAVRRTVWNVAFQDEEKCNAMYDWLCHRIERWEDWLKLAYGSGSERLTLRLLTLTVLDERLKLVRSSTT